MSGLPGQRVQRRVIAQTLPWKNVTPDDADEPECPPFGLFIPIGAEVVNGQVVIRGIKPLAEWPDNLIPDDGINPLWTGPDSDRRPAGFPVDAFHNTGNVVRPGGFGECYVGGPAIIGSRYTSDQEGGMGYSGYGPSEDSWTPGYSVDFWMTLVISQVGTIVTRGGNLSLNCRLKQILRNDGEPVECEPDTQSMGGGGGSQRWSLMAECFLFQVGPQGGGAPLEIPIDTQVLVVRQGGKWWIVGSNCNGAEQ